MLQFYQYSAAPSSPPEDIKVISVDPASLLLSWQPPLVKNCNGPITGYVLQIAMVGSYENMIVNVANDLTFAMSGLLANVEYSVIMAAVNANGTGPFSKPVIETSGEDSKLNLLHKYVHSCTRLFCICIL